ncbi:hypothetical protein EJB05_49919, partial [Eragrostis curvula]
NTITPTPRKDNKSLIISLVAAAAASAFLFLLLGILRTIDNPDERSNQFLSPNGASPNRFSYDMLATATGNFSDSKKLGEGGFGSVYKGFLIKMNLDVAIKRMSKHSRLGWKEYISEITIINHLRHRNLVQLIGFCHTHDELLLVYKLMPKGSLDKHLHNQENILPWKPRYDIVLGIGSALLYLHQDCEQGVLHRDIKSNIYSFGVLLLEVACGRRPAIMGFQDNTIHLTQWVSEMCGRGNILDGRGNILDAAEHQNIHDYRSIRSP